MFQFQSFKFRNGQTAIEFVILIMAVLFLFVGLLYFIQGKIVDSQREALTVAVNEVALTVQSEINLAKNSVDGYSRKFRLPSNLNGHSYQVNIIDKSVFVRTDDGKNAVALPIGEVMGDVLIGTNLVRRENSVIFLNY